MALNKNINIIILMFVICCDCLEEIPIGDRYILNTEAIIRNTVNKLFWILGLKRIHEMPRLQEYTITHKYFVSLTLQDDHNLKKILEITKANQNYNTIYSNNTDFIAIINEIINEDKTNSIEMNDINVISFIEHFVSRLKILRHSYADNTVYVNINMKVLDHLKNARAHSNISRSDKQDYNDESIIRENEFWEPSGRRIYKGERTKIKYFPFMASVHIFNNFHCAGSIIKSDLVITASSCLQLAWNNRLFRENPAFLSVRVGSSFYSGGGEVIPVLEIYFHPLYDPKSLRNNLCIVRLVRRLKFGKRVKRVKRIDIDRHPWSLPLTTPGITILGWGAKGRSGVIFNPWKNILSFSILDIYPLQDCRDVYTKEYVTRKHFCAGFLSKGGGACNRDVGGPGVVDGKLMGVISFGSPTCGTPDAPTVFTKLGFYTDWIEEIMEKKVPVTLKKTTEQPPFDVYSFLPKRRPTTTTFKIPPLTGKKLEPLSILDIDKALRLLDENLFKEFLSTMFTSGEIETYRNIIKHEKDVMRDDGIKSTTEKDIVTGGSLSVENEPKLVTRILNYSEEIKDITQSIELERSQTEEKNSKENSHDVNFEISKMEGRSQSIERLNDDHQPLKHIKNSNVESEIAQFMKNIDLKKIIEEEVMVTPNIKLDTKGKNESVVTFLYLSDNEKSKDVVVPEENGLSIATNDGFIDMTRSNSKNNYIVPENEMLGLVSEAIENELKSKINKKL